MSVVELIVLACRRKLPASPPLPEFAGLLRQGDFLGPDALADGTQDSRHERRHGGLRIAPRNTAPSNLGGSKQSPKPTRRGDSADITGRIVGFLPPRRSPRMRIEPGELQIGVSEEVSGQDTRFLEHCRAENQSSTDCRSRGCASPCTSSYRLPSSGECVGWGGMSLPPGQ